MDELAKAIRSKEAKIVMIGLGYVGLPVACLFARAGFRVVGIRRSSEKVALINQGVCPIKGKEPGLAELLAEEISSGRLRASTDYAECRDAQVVLIAVETPVDKVTRKPKYEALQSALEDLGCNLQPGTLVVVESTIAPGTMDKVVKPTLEKASGLRVNDGFYLATCPERVMPGSLLHNIQNCHRVVGGMSPETAQVAVELYRNIVKADLDPVDCLTAELVKTMENAYRDVQIAFANEMALLCQSMGADVWQVRELVNKSPHRDMHLPGAGVGGQCLPKDSWLLIANAGADFEARLIPAARAVNDGMPLHMATLIEDALSERGRSLAGARIVILGVAYLENSDEIRNSPALPLINTLKARGADVVVHDPYVQSLDGMELVPELGDALRGRDCAAIVTKHQTYFELDLRQMKELMRTPVIVDGRNVLDPEVCEKFDFVYRGIGQEVRRFAGKRRVAAWGIRVNGTPILGQSETDDAP